MTGKKKNQMYPWVDVKRNFIGGKCPHECVYCYVEALKKRFPGVRTRYSGELYLIEKELGKGEGCGHMTFVQDCGDLFAEQIPDEWIDRVLRHCSDYPENTYLFQSKNPQRFIEFKDRFPKNAILGTTIESNRDYGVSKAPDVYSRANGIESMGINGFTVMVSVEPIMDFDSEDFVELLQFIGPEFVSIGADSKNNRISEPTPEKVRAFIDQVRRFTEVKLKSNLARLGVAKDD